jgi:type I restriction enzyme S subunit
MSDWVTRQIDEVAELLDNLRVPVNEEARSARKGRIPYYGANGLQGFIDKPLFNEPLILLAEDGGNFDDFEKRPIAYRVDGPSWVNNHAHVVRAKPGTHQPFLFYALEHKDIRRWIKGGTRGKLNGGDLRRVEVRLPTSVDEQRRIADLLSAVDEQIELSEQEGLKIAMRRVGLFDALLNTALINPSDDISGGRLAGGWKRLPLAQVTSKLLDFRGRTPLKLGMSWGGGSIPALSANNVEMGRINLEKECYLASEALYGRWMTNGDCSKNDVVMTLEAPLGNVALITDAGKYILSQRVILLKPNLADVDGNYLYIYLRWRRFQELLAKNSTGTTATGIRRKALESLPVLVPSPQQRERITATLLSCLEIESDWALEIEKLRALKRGLMAETLVGPQEKRTNS